MREILLVGCEAAMPDISSFSSECVLPSSVVNRLSTAQVFSLKSILVNIGAAVQVMCCLVELLLLPCRIVNRDGSGATALLLLLPSVDRTTVVFRSMMKPLLCEFFWLNSFAPKFVEGKKLLQTF